jgi:phytoene dehydrogenase-like protein
LNTRAHYDVAIIGAGISGLAAGIRLAHFGRKVCIFERHNAPGGLNSFYSMGGRKFDVGLHALTNFVKPGVRGTALGLLLRQLRIERGALDLCEQRQSRVAFGPRGEHTLRMTNDFTVFEGEVATKFPRQIDGFRRLTQLVRETRYDQDAPVVSARAVVRRHIDDPLLEEMLLCPLLMYGSARENDMDFGQFVLIFHAILLEGMARPFEGVRALIRVLLERYRAAGGERRMKCGVRQIVAREGRASALVLDSGEDIAADQILSSIGAPETAALIEGAGEPTASDPPPPPSGAITFVETISVFNRQPAEFGWGDDAIIFFNDSERLSYACPRDQVDPRSGVACIPNNFDYGPDRALSEGFLRVTCLANYDRWTGLPEETYQADKRRWFPVMQGSARRFLPPADDASVAGATVATDMFTPRTVTKFTGHFAGAIYGSPVKNPRGRTSLGNLHLCGTDQGMLGVVGAMLSGIMIANQNILQRGGNA